MTANASALLPLLSVSAVQPRTVSGRESADEAELIAAAGDDDPSAFDEIFRRHVRQVYAHMARLVGPCEELEDLVQQTFVSLYRALPRFRGDAQLSTFVFRITANTATDHLRRKGRRRIDSFAPEDLDKFAAPHGCPEAQVKQKQQLTQAFDLLAKLKPAKRVAFVLRVVGGLSLEEIGEVVGAKAPAVGQRIKSAQRQLQSLVDKQSRCRAKGNGSHA